MTDLATALANTPGKLPDYAGRSVIRTAIKVTNAGDGLSQGVAIDPQVLPVGATVYVVLECVVDSHEHDRVLDKGNDTGLLLLNQVLKAGTGTIIDADLVREAIDHQADKIRLAREQAAGVQRLPLGDAPADPEPTDDETAADVRPFQPPGSARNPFPAGAGA